jgi:alginate O-acetyltransferase complex protein AlgI
LIFSNPKFFLIFLPLTLLGFQLLGRFGRRSAIGFLALMSLVFYAQWSTKYLLLLLGSILVNYLLSIAIDQTSKRPALQSFWLTAGIVANLSALCYFKYLFPSLDYLSYVLHRGHNFGSVILPLGISFFTFTQISYLIDLKQGVATRQGLLSYSLFVTFFPHLIAGPIIHHKEMMPQFSEERRYQLNRDDMALGLTWFTMGMFKKVMIADRISPVADAFFAQVHHAGLLPAWLGALTYSMQLYFDFSGYSDMAVGLARMFSIRFPLNFNSPYKAPNIIDFWQRWHMTLTRYIMDYLYGPLQMRVGRKRLEQGKKISRKATATPEGFFHMVAVPTVVTMFIVGIWHGAGKQFLIFGLLHGVYITINHAWRIFVRPESRARKLLSVPVGILITYLAVLVGEVFFRAESLHDAVSVLVDMSGWHGLGAAWPISQLLLMMGLFAVVWLLPNTQEILGQTQEGDLPNRNLVRLPRWSPTLPWWAAATLAFAISMFYSTASTSFLYFQF